MSQVIEDAEFTDVNSAEQEQSGPLITWSGFYYFVSLVCLWCTFRGNAGLETATGILMMTLAANLVIKLVMIKNNVGQYYKFARFAPIIYFNFGVLFVAFIIWGVIATFVGGTMMMIERGETPFTDPQERKSRAQYEQWKRFAEADRDQNH